MQLKKRGPRLIEKCVLVREQLIALHAHQYHPPFKAYPPVRDHDVLTQTHHGYHQYHLRTQLQCIKKNRNQGFWKSRESRQQNKQPSSRLHPTTQMNGNFHICSNCLSANASPFLLVCWCLHILAPQCHPSGLALQVSLSM